MAVRTKMSTARSRGRTVVKTTTKGKNGAKVLPEVGVKGVKQEELSTEKPKEYGGDYRATRKDGVDYSIADVTPEDDKLIRKYLRVKDNEDYVIPKADYDVWKSSGRKSPEEYNIDISKGKPNPFQANYEGDVGRNNLVLQMYGKGKAPKAKPDPANLRAAAEKVKPLDKFATLKTKKIEPGATRDLVVKEKNSKEDIRVAEEVSGPKGRTVSRKKLAIDVKPNTKRDYRRQLGGKALDRNKGIVVKTEDKYKGPRLSEKMKYKKEEKLAGARERVLGMSGVATEDQMTKSGRVTKRGEKIEGSAQRIRDLKALYGSDSIRGEKVEASTASGKGGSEKRKILLNEAKSNIKEIGKLSRAQAKGLRKEGSAKGKAITKAKEMKAEYKAAKRPAKFSKGTSKEDLAKDVAAMKSTKTAAELKAMKTSAKSAMKEARGMTKTKEEKSMIRSGVKATRGVAKEARSYKGDIRKGLRMEKRDMLAEKVAAKTSDAKKARKAEKGRTMRGTSYFSMTELKKTTPLSETSSSKKQAGTKRYSK